MTWWSRADLAWKEATLPFVVDLDQPVKVVMGNATLFEGKAPRTAATISRTLADRGDAGSVYMAEVAVKLPQAAPAGTTP